MAVANVFTARNLFIVLKKQKLGKNNSATYLKKKEQQQNRKNRI